MKIHDYLQILQFSNQGIIATDKGGLITFVNKRAKEILQYKKKKVVGTSTMKLPAAELRGIKGV